MSATVKEKTGQRLRTTSGPLSDQDITDAYIYLLGREIILKQQRLDFEEEGFEWNNLIHRTPGGVAWANPNLDVAYSEAWVAVDENVSVIVDIPKITGRYFTWQMLNGWGETVLNINERTFPYQPHGKYALCLKGSKPKFPPDIVRIDLPSKTSRVLLRVELGDDPNEAIRLQHLFRLIPLGQPRIERPFLVPVFEGMQLPGSGIFENASAKLSSEPDINQGMDELKNKTKSVEALVYSGVDGRSRVDRVINTIGKPLVIDKINHIGDAKNGWLHPSKAGNYGNDYLMRTAANLAGIWANNAAEVTYYAAFGLDGSSSYSLTFPKDALPAAKAKYFWSIIAVDTVRFQVLPNPLKRYLLNKQSALKYNADGSLTLVFGPKQPAKYPESNWLPTINGLKYNLTFRFYGPTADVSEAKYFPPPLLKENL